MLQPLYQVEKSSFQRLNFPTQLRPTAAAPITSILELFGLLSSFDSFDSLGPDWPASGHNGCFLLLKQHLQTQQQQQQQSAGSKVSITFGPLEVENRVFQVSIFVIRDTARSYRIRTQLSIKLHVQHAQPLTGVVVAQVSWYVL